MESITKELVFFLIKQLIKTARKSWKFSKQSKQPIPDV